MSSKFTVVLCVHRPPAMLAFAIETVLRQSHDNFELFVVSDGSPRETLVCANAFAERDGRVRVFDFPKGERKGEANRHLALAEATGEFVAHIADDDLWFPDHLKELALLLTEVEFGNLILTTVMPDGSFSFHPGDLADATTRERMLTERWNFFGPTVAGYRLSTYRRLPVGWAPGPENIWADLNMWRKFLRLDGIRTGTRFSVQSIALRQSERGEIAMEQRRAESEPWFKLVSDPQACSQLRERIWNAMAKRYADIAQQSSLRQQIIESSSRRTKELNAKISARDSEHARLTTMLMGRDDEIARQAKTIVERDKEHARLRAKLEERDAEIARRSQMIVERDAERTRVRGKMADRDAELARLRAIAMSGRGKNGGD